MSAHYNLADNIAAAADIEAGRGGHHLHAAECEIFGGSVGVGINGCDGRQAGTGDGEVVGESVGSHIVAAVSAMLHWEVAVLDESHLAVVD